MNFETRETKSLVKSDSNNFYFEKKLHPSTILTTHLAKGKQIYVYKESYLSLVNNAPFTIIREATKNLLINPGTLIKKLDSGKPFKGYYYYYCKALKF